MEIDHVFICVPPEAPEADTLKAFGLTEGSPNRHPGQGTACRRFFFQNAYLELLYLESPAESQNERTRPTRLFDRMPHNAADASPFGIGFRPATNSEKKVPFPSWPYKPAYLPGSLIIDIGKSPIMEPMWLFLAFATRPDGAPAKKREAWNQPNGFREITSLRLAMPNMTDISEAANIVEKVGEIEFFEGDTPLLEVEFDTGSNARSQDFRPVLPLVFRW